MGVQFRSRRTFGPLVLNFTQRGLSSWSVRLGKWSWNSRTRAHRYDLPGPFTWRQDKGRR